MKLYTTSICYFLKDGGSVGKKLNVATTVKCGKVLVKHDFFDTLDEAKILSAESESREDILKAIIDDINQFDVIREANGPFTRFGLDFLGGSLKKVCF